MLNYRGMVVHVSACIMYTCIDCDRLQSEGVQCGNLAEVLERVMLLNTHTLSKTLFAYTCRQCSTRMKILSANKTRPNLSTWKAWHWVCTYVCKHVYKTLKPLIWHQGRHNVWVFMATIRWGLAPAMFLAQSAWKVQCSLMNTCVWRQLHIYMRVKAVWWIHVSEGSSQFDEYMWVKAADIHKFASSNNAAFKQMKQELRIQTQLQ